MRQHRANQALSFSLLFRFPKFLCRHQTWRGSAGSVGDPGTKQKFWWASASPAGVPPCPPPLPESGGRWLTRASECPARPSVTDGAQRWFSCNDDSGKERTCSRPEGERRSLVPAPGRRARSVWCPGRLAKGDGDWSPLRAEPRTPRALPTGPALTLPQTEGQPHSRGLSAVWDCVPRDRKQVLGGFRCFSCGREPAAEKEVTAHAGAVGTAESPAGRWVLRAGGW